MRRKLLLADDSVTIQKVIEITLADKDYDLRIAGDGDEALRMATSEAPDLIMADVFMPGLDGYELCRNIRTNEVLKDVPVLLLAGTFEPFDKDKATDVGANDWIVKPFSSQNLIDKVDELLAAVPAKEQWQAKPSVSPGDEDILQALEEVTAGLTATVPAAVVAPEPIVAPEPVIAPASALDDFSFETNAVDESASENSASSVVDPFSASGPDIAPIPEPASFEFDTSSVVDEPSVETSPSPVSKVDVTPELSPFEGFNLPEEPATAVEEPAKEMFPAAAESFSFDTPDVETTVVSAPVLPEPVVAPDAESSSDVVELQEADIAEEGAYGAVPERVEKRIAFLSDEQLTEIVERVAGAVIAKLAAPIVENVVWEVVPDLTESMVREEMAKIKAQKG